MHATRQTAKPLTGCAVLRCTNYTGVRATNKQTGGVCLSQKKDGHKGLTDQQLPVGGEGVVQASRHSASLSQQPRAVSAMLV